MFPLFLYWKRKSTETLFICCVHQQERGSNKENKERSFSAGTREPIWILERRVQSVGWGAQKTEVCEDDKRDAAQRLCGGKREGNPE